MARITVEEQKDLSVLPADTILLLKVDSTKVEQVDGARGSWEKLEFTFKILEVLVTGDGSNPRDYDDLITEKIWGSCSFNLTNSPENKLRMWSEAILGMDLGLGFELDTDMFDGREVRGVTRQYEKRKKDARGIPFKGHGIESLLPRNGGIQNPQQAAPQQQSGWGSAPAGYQNPPAQPQGQPAAAQQQPLGQGQGQDPWGGNWGPSDEPPF